MMSLAAIVVVFYGIYTIYRGYDFVVHPDKSLLNCCETEEEAAEAHLEKGIELLEKGDFAAAQLELKSANKGNKSTADTYFYLALLDEKAKHYLSMQDNLKKTLKLEPEHQQARVKLGKLEFLMGEVGTATEHAEILLVKNPQDIEALVLKSSILLKQSKQDDAKVVIDQVMELDPANIDGLNPKFSEDKTKASNQKKMIIDRLSNMNYKVDNDRVTLLDSKGELLEDEHRNPIKFEDKVKELTTSLFDLNASKKRSSGGGDDGKVEMEARKNLTGMVLLQKIKRSTQV